MSTAPTGCALRRRGTGCVDLLLRTRARRPQQHSKPVVSIGESMGFERKFYPARTRTDGCNGVRRWSAVKSIGRKRSVGYAGYA